MLPEYFFKLEDNEAGPFIPLDFSTKSAFFFLHLVFDCISV